MATKAEIEFAKRALKEALERMKPELIAANEAAHKIVGLEVKDGPDESRLVELGYLVDWAGNMCTPQIKLLGDIAVVLHNLHQKEENREGEPVAHRH
jgi:hypothetical protein